MANAPHQSAVHVGSTFDKQSVDNVADALVKILSVHRDEKTIRAALRVFSQLAQVNGVSFAHCHINFGAADGKAPVGVKIDSNDTHVDTFE